MYVALYRPGPSSAWRAGVTLFRSRAAAEQYLAAIGPHHSTHVAWIDLP